MTPIPAKVLSVDKQSSEYRVLVQIELGLGPTLIGQVGSLKASPFLSLNSFITPPLGVKTPLRSFLLFERYRGILPFGFPGLRSAWI